MTWPKSVDWRAIDFGVEIEWVGVPQGAVEPLPGWEIVAEDSLFLADGRMVDPVVSGEALEAELVSPRLRWDDRDQIEETAAVSRTLALRATGRAACTSTQTPVRRARPFSCRRWTWHCGRKTP